MEARQSKLELALQQELLQNAQQAAARDALKRMERKPN